MIRIQQLKLPVSHSEEDLRQAIYQSLRLFPQTAGKRRGQQPDLSFEIVRQSIDARKKPDIYYVYTVDVICAQEDQILRRNKAKTISRIIPKEYRFPYAADDRWDDGASRAVERHRGEGPGQMSLMPGKESPSRQPIRRPPVIVGTGPAGLFCGLMLARAGLCPILLERGEPVEARQRTVESFWKTGVLCPDSNVQFGEGGAGTFSDGKLNTLVKDPDGRIRFVLKTFVEAGADPDILYSYKPHVGTDVLAGVVRHIREEIRSLGGQVYFGTCLEDIQPEAGGGYSLTLRRRAVSGRSPDPSDEWREIPDPARGWWKQAADEAAEGAQAGQRFFLHADALVLAIGHSARDTFRMLLERHFPLEAKSFAVGVRVEHPQSWIDAAMYGADCPYRMPPAPYKLTHRLSDGRGVYSFCMCPGGYVVNASSEPGMLAVNGMSYHARDGRNANSAIVVTVSPEDYGGSGPLAGLEFQRRLERSAYLEGKGNIPVQRFADFCQNRASMRTGTVLPQTRGAYAPANVRSIFPPSISAAVEEGILAFDRQIPGFAHADALLSGVESRTSSPVRILRGDTREAQGFPGIYPCGEGAGYAGGITSAALDGIRVAEAVAGNFRF